MFGLIAIAIHSATDFGQRLPANGCLTATFCGLIIAMSRLEKRYQSKSEGRVNNRTVKSPFVRRILSIGAAAALLLVWGNAIRHTYGSYHCGTMVRGRPRNRIAPASRHHLVDRPRLCGFNLGHSSGSRCCADQCQLSLLVE